MQGSTLFWLLALGGTAAFLMLRAQRQLRSTSHPRVSTQRQRPSAALPAEKPADAQRWEVEMHDTMRAWTAQLDSKLAALQHFIRLAEQASARLEAAIAEARYVDGSAARAGAQLTSSVARAANQADALRASLSHGNSAVDDTLAGRQGHPAADAAPPTEPSNSDRPVSRIHSLADAGYGSAAIAQQVGSPIGEVELILSLRRQGSQLGARD